jgi:hypothetical protein
MTKPFVIESFGAQKTLSFYHPEDRFLSVSIDVVNFVLSIPNPDLAHEHQKRKMARLIEVFNAWVDKVRREEQEKFARYLTERYGQMAALEWKEREQK